MAIKTKIVTTLDIAALEPHDIMQVYSGKDGMCCCGCSGDHRYNSEHLKMAAKDRGYSISKDEVNDKKVRRTLQLIKDNAHKAEVAVNERGPKRGNRHSAFTAHVSLVIGDRLHIIYLTRKEVK